MSLRIGPFQAARHQGDCVTATGEGRAVSCGVDTERRSRDDGDARSCQFRGELSRHMFAIGGGGTRSDDSHTGACRRNGSRVPTDP